MGLAELLARGWSRESSSWRDVWELLYPELRSHLSSVREFQRLQDSERDEFLHDLAVKLLSIGPLAIAGKSDGQCHEYIKRMFLNLQCDRARKSRRETVLAELPELAEWPVAEAMILLKDVWGLLERVYQALWEKRRESYRPELEKDWAELHGLLSGEWDMERILLKREQVGPGASEDERVEAARRIYKRHSRLRKSLVLMAREMVHEGQLSTEEFGQVETLSNWMDRSQQKGGKP